MAHKRPHEVIVVADSRGAKFYENQGIRIEPRLREIGSLTAPENPPTREQGTDKPGRVFESVGAKRSTTEPTDWHEMTEQRFAGTVAGALQRVHLAKPIGSLILVAPPRFLSYLRDALRKDLRAQLAADVSKDFTKLDLEALQKRLGEDLEAV